MGTGAEVGKGVVPCSSLLRYSELPASHQVTESLTCFPPSFRPGSSLNHQWQEQQLRGQGLGRAGQSACFLELGTGVDG